MSKLSAREQKLLAVLGVVAVAIIFIAIPVYLFMSLSEARSSNENIRQLLARMDGLTQQLAERRQEQDAIKLKLANPAPALASFIEKIARDNGVELPESKDLPDVDGKQYKERVTTVKLRKVGLKPLVLMLEQIKRSQHPVSISRLKITTRSADQYDVDLTVSAYDKKEEAGGSDKAAKKPASKKSAKGREL